jgi:hypothetical protein
MCDFSAVRKQRAGRKCLGKTEKQRRQQSECDSEKAATTFSSDHKITKTTGHPHPSMKTKKQCKPLFSSFVDGVCALDTIACGILAVVYITFVKEQTIKIFRL